MMKHILAAVGLLALPACTANFPAARPTAPGMAAPITPPAQNVIPPVEFDHPYTGKLTIERSSSQAEIKARCAPTSFSYHLGCAWAMAGRCHILMADDATIREHNWTPEIVLRHERGHCNFGLRIIPEPGAQIERCRSYAIDGFCGQLPELCAGIRDVQEVAIVHGRRDHDCDPAVAA